MDRIEEFIEGSFSRAYYDSASNCQYLYNNFSNNDVYKYFIVAHTDPNGCEIPTIFSNLGYSFYKEKHKITIPLFANGAEQVRIRRLTSTILSDFLHVNWETRLQCVKTNKGDKYYGAPGLILDKNFNPILVLTIKHDGIVLGNRFKDLRCVCHINRSIFDNQEGLIEKAIYKKIIPFCANNVPNYVSIARYGGVPTKMTIVIDDCSQFIERPVIPRPSTTSDASINDLVVRHLDLICP